jgi:hypothetical protein
MPERITDRLPDADRGSNKRTALTSIAAIASALAASGCCLPVLPFIAAAGLAGGSAFLWAARPYLLGASITFIGYGFYRTWRTKKCHRRPGIIGLVLLWVSAFLVAISILFPQIMANAAASLLAR